MDKHARKIITSILTVAGIFVTGWFILNTFLNYRLENYLNNELDKKIAELTDGFYSFSFKHLDIDFFTGELFMEGVDLKPDSGVFQQWEERDSLPKTYFNLKIQSIEFKGINLIWRFNYKKLHFDLFEIKNLDLQAFDSYSNTKRNKPKKKAQSFKTLHEMIKPYIDVLSAEKMSMENVSASYILQDSMSQSIYALKNIQFHGWGFRLDEFSAESGKLLYYDNFEITTNSPQNLLINDQFALNTNNIRISTADSVIIVEEIHLIPRQNQKNNSNIPEAGIKNVEVNGIVFKRKNTFNYLDARSFEIYEAEINYRAFKRDEQLDSFPLPASLYEAVSPLLSHVSIETIGINNARFNYSLTTGKETDTYTMQDFNFRADSFLIDSLSESLKRFRYLSHFSVQASGLEASMPTKNHKLKIKELILDTQKGIFFLDHVTIAPLSLLSPFDYMSGSLDSLNINSLIYDKGIDAGELIVSSPTIKYTKMSSPLRPAGRDSGSKNSTDHKKNVLDLMALFSDYLAVHTIRMNNANLTLSDINAGSTYKIPYLNFYADNFRIDEQTKKNQRMFFDYEQAGAEFKGLVGLLENQHQLTIESGSIDTKKEHLFLHNIQVMPREQEKDEKNNLFHITIPVINLKKIDYDKRKGVKAGTLLVHSPSVRIRKGRQSENKENTDSPVFPLLPEIYMGKIDISELDYKFIDDIPQDSTSVKFKRLFISDLALSPQKIRLGEIKLYTPEIDLVKNKDSENKLSESDSFPIDTIDIRKIDIKNPDVSFSSPDAYVGIDMEHLYFSNIYSVNHKNNFSFESDSGIMRKSTVNFCSYDTVSPSNLKQENSESEKDVYDNLNPYIKRLSLGSFYAPETTIDYRYSLAGDSLFSREMKADLSFRKLEIDTDKKTADLEDISLRAKNLHFPISKGFYTVRIGDMDLNKQKGIFKLEDIQMLPSYSKFEFAYREPSHKDWFDIRAGNLLFSGVDFNTLFREKTVKSKNILLENISLLNFKNQKIEIEHNIMPMIYEEIQQFPIRFHSENLDVRNFSIVYEELTKKGKIPGKIFFTDMNVQASDFTNVVSSPLQYISLNVNGKWMGTGPFTAVWKIPVDSLNDHFSLHVNLKKFDLEELNQIITPMAPAEVRTGRVSELRFVTEASSKGAEIDMLFLYNDLNINIYRDVEEGTYNTFFTNLANYVIKQNNPDKKRKPARTVSLSIERDPYHSTFNYFWQILQPSLVESVGISQGKQNFIKKASGFFSKVKNFFRKEKKKDN